MPKPEEYEYLSPSDAIAFQKQLAQKINICELDQEVNTIGGADISFNKNSDIVYAGIIILSYPGLKELERSTVIARTKFPYISGLLAFREVPALLQAWNQLNTKPDLMVLDGQGIAHERRTGIATHFGLLTNVPSLGCAKSRLTGRFEDPDNNIFAESAMWDKGDQIGVALRTKKNCKPVYISPGHRISISQSVEIIKNCVKGYRIPEPTRLAHLLVNDVRLKDASNDTGQQRLF